MISIVKLLFAKYKVALFAAGFGLCFLAGAFTAHKIDGMYWTAHEANTLSANLASWQKAFANYKQAQQELQKHEANNAVQQSSVAAHAAAVIQEVPTYVKVTATDRSCISYGFIRVLDSEILDVMPGQLDLPAGKFDDDCSPLSSAVVAERIIENFKRAKQNEAQLNALKDAIAELEQAQQDSEK